MSELEGVIGERPEPRARGTAEFPYQLEETIETLEVRAFVMRLASEYGSIVSSNNCSVAEIEAARAGGRFLVIDSLGFVLRARSTSNIAAVTAAEEQAKAAEAERDALQALLNTPEVDEFDKAVPLEAAHQVQRWGARHDAGKTPADWFWLVGYLAGKAVAAHIGGNTEKAKHHCVSTAAALRNWHAHVRTGESAMRPGIGEEKRP